MNIKNIITKIFSLTLIFGVIFFSTSSVFALEEWLLVCSPQSATCSAGCRDNPTNTNSVNSNWWTIRVSGDSWFINWYNFDLNYTSDFEDEAISNSFMSRYSLSNNTNENVRKIQQKINQLAAVYPNWCSSLCEDWRFWNTTISRMGSCMCVDAEAEPDGLWDCPDWYTSDNKGCCELTVATCTTSINAPEYNAWVVFNVTVNFNSNWIDATNGWNFSIIWWTISEETCSYEDWDNSCGFKVTPDNTWSFITITSPEWKIQYSWNVLCPEAEVNVDPETEDESICDDPLEDLNWECCMPKAERWQCSNEDFLDAAYSVYEGLDLSWLYDESCEIFSEEYWFCPWCDTPPVNWGCTYYSTWWSQGTGWCCEQDCVPEVCWSWEVLNWCECVCDPSEACCGIQLNTVVPFIGDCIEMTTQNNTNGANGNTSYVNQLNAFPFLMMGLSKILVTVILIFSFLVVIAAGLMMVTWVYEEWNYTKWLERIKKVIVALILLWSSGLILKLINPTFFGW